MIINLKQSLKKINGEELKTENKEVVTFGGALSNILLSSNEGSKMKLFVLAQKCFSEESLDVDLSDLTLIKNVTRTSEVYNALVLGQCELLLEEIK